MKTSTAQPLVLRNEIRPLVEVCPPNNLTSYTRTERTGTGKIREEQNAAVLAEEDDHQGHQGRTQRQNGHGDLRSSSGRRRHLVSSVCRRVRVE
ncbi:Uncharacterized protein DAT39_021850 [Clarias magur]|uniref:Uncharacterized protein n=1 Tax=Clarias magur TaxID=1594786 RepID=A0A8J4TCC4_CLAMG|nr:Uncharacterized protein DAT39_021850 [Clarias magur]